MSDKIFVNGLVVKRNDNAPEFLLCSQSFKVDEFVEWIKQQPGPWVNVDIKRSRNGKIYGEVNTWKPSEKLADVARRPAAADDDSEIPF